MIHKRIVMDLNIVSSGSTGCDLARNTGHQTVMHRTVFLQTKLESQEVLVVGHDGEV